VGFSVQKQKKKSRLFGSLTAIPEEAHKKKSGLFGSEAKKKK
jgi:hypothetical protein